MVIEVSDSASNRNEQIQHAAQAIGRSRAKRLVFEAIHHHKKAVKTVDEIVEHTKLARKQVLDAGRQLANRRIVEQTQHDGRVAYRKNDFLQQHKREILALCGDPQKLRSYPTKRTPTTLRPINVTIPASTANVEQITIDDISTFKRVKGVSVHDHLQRDIAETVFKRGIQSILNEPGSFRDWGGEKNDLLSTRLVLRSRRRTVAFAFKGPGTTGPLTPRKMGKNADQIQRLFQSAADIFLLQYWREIDESVIEQMRSFAIAKSATTGQRVWFGIIDGFDSQRIFEAYRSHFPD